MIEFLVHARTHQKAQRGAPQHLIDQSDLDAGFNWGRREVPPDYCYIRVSDAEKADGLPLLTGGYNDFDVVEVAPKTYRVVMSDRVLALASDKGVTPDVEQWLLREYGGLKTFEDTRNPDKSKTFVFEKQTTREELLLDLIDKPTVQLMRGRFYFPGSAVDQALGAKGGRLVTNKASGILTAVIDRLR